LATPLQATKYLKKITYDPSFFVKGKVSALAVVFFMTHINLCSAAKSSEKSSTESATEKIILGGGCFWCIEAVFQMLPGVVSVKSGYAGGQTKNPTYKQVCSGQTGHAEVVLVEFDPRILTLDDILDVFWQAHDPTTLNRQGADVGTQYRSVIILTDAATQRPVVEKSLAKAAKNFQDPIVTEILDGADFFHAEDYHQNFYNENPHHPYCRAVIAPKLQKIKIKKKH
jgi:peptide-methionine (S)-S-oxide reductase